MLIKITYRGVLWLLLRQDDRVFVRAVVPGALADSRLINRVVRGLQTDQEIIEELAREAILRVECAATGVDGVPWVLHLIEDAIARDAAVAAFKRSRGA